MRTGIAVLRRGKEHPFSAGVISLPRRRGPASESRRNEQTSVGFRQGLIQNALFLFFPPKTPTIGNLQGSGLKSQVSDKSKQTEYWTLRNAKVVLSGSGGETKKKVSVLLLRP